MMLNLFSREKKLQVKMAGDERQWAELEGGVMPNSNFPGSDLAAYSFSSIGSNRPHSLLIGFPLRKKTIDPFPKGDFHNSPSPAS